MCWVFLLKRHSWWQVLKLLAGPFLRQHAIYQQRIIVLLLDHVIILPAQRKLSMAALKALKKQDVPELSGNSRPQSVLLFSSKRLHFLATLSAIIFCIAPQRLLFAGLQDVDAELPDKSPLKPAGAASDSSIADYAHNKKIIAAIAHGLQGHRDAEGVVALATAGHEAAQHVLLLALCHVCSEAAEKGVKLRPTLDGPLLLEVTPLNSPKLLKKECSAAH